MIEIPWQNVAADTLNLLLEEIVTRDGTDYGVVEKTVAQRLEEARTSLQKGRAMLVWDETTESASLVERRALSRLSD